MDLTAVLLRFAAGVPHVLLVAVPGRPGLRMDTELLIRRRGWPEATSPAEADVLLVAGHPGPELGEVVESLWRGIPAPRVRLDLGDDATTAHLERLLDRLPTRLADVRLAREEAIAAAAVSDVADESHAAPAQHGEHGEHGEDTHAAGHEAHLNEHSGHAGDGEPPDQGGDTAHGRHEHHERDHAEHADSGSGHEDDSGHAGDHQHHHMDMPLPGGLAMADVAEDRDGLALDVLHLPLGPVLPDWPAGLVIDVELQGDVISSAEARVLDVAELRPSAPVAAAVRDLDVVARVLAVAGWPGPAARARDLRDRARAGEPADGLSGLLRLVRRSRVLRLMLRRVEFGDGVDVAELLERRLARIEAHAAGRTVGEPERPVLAELGGRLAGAEFTAARLLVAAHDPDVDGAATPAGLRDREPGER